MLRPRDINTANSPCWEALPVTYPSDYMLTDTELTEARRHLPARCAFSQPDPLAGKYPWLSPYAFCAADPINLTDPTGMEFTKRAEKFVKRVRTYSEKQIEKKSSAIEKLQKQIDSGDISDEEITKYKEKIANLLAQKDEFKNVIAELDVLTNSSQVYDINVDNRLDGTKAETTFNFETGTVVMNFGRMTTIDHIAHELKHCYQFETGAYSVGVSNPNITLYDKHDELEAYRRGELFGGDHYPTLNSLPSVYSNRPDGPLDINNHQSYMFGINNDDAAIRNAVISKLLKQRNAFRAYGKTYFWRGE